MKIEVLPKLISETIRDVKKTLLHFLVSVILVLLFETADCARLLSELGHIKTTDRNRLHDILKWSLADLRRKSTWKGIDSHSKTCRKTCWPMEQGLDWQNSLVPSSRYVHRMTFQFLKPFSQFEKLNWYKFEKTRSFEKTKKKHWLRDHVHTPNGTSDDAASKFRSIMRLPPPPHEVLHFSCMKSP